MEALPIPTSLSIERKGDNVCKELLDGVDPTSLFIAVRNLNLTLLHSMLVNRKSSLRSHVNDLDENGWGLLHYLAISIDKGATMAMYDEALDTIIFVAGGDVNLTSSKNETALLLAAHCGNHEFAMALLKYRPDIKMYDNDARSALTVAQDRVKDGEVTRRKSPSGNYSDLYHHRVFLQQLLDHGREKSSHDCMNEKKRKIFCNKSVKHKDSEENYIMRPSSERSTSDYTVAEEFRKKGNEAFKKGKFLKAEKLYNLSIETLENYLNLSNRAACFLEMAKWRINRFGFDKVKSFVCEVSKRALDDAMRASELNPTFSKSWYRQAKAYIGMGNFLAAQDCLKKGLDKCPGNKKMKNLLHMLDHSEKKEEGHTLTKKENPSLRSGNEGQVKLGVDHEGKSQSFQNEFSISNSMDDLIAKLFLS